MVCGGLLKLEDLDAMKSGMKRKSEMRPERYLCSFTELYALVTVFVFYDSVLSICLHHVVRLFFCLYLSSMHSYPVFTFFLCIDDLYNMYYFLFIPISTFCSLLLPSNTLSAIFHS